MWTGDFVTSIGQTAIDDYIKGNQGRKVELSLEVLGEARTGTGSPDGPAGEGETSKIYGQAFNDASLPGRLFRGTKRLLGSSDSGRTLIFDRAFRLVALVTPILVGIRKALQQNLEDTTHACLGHPVNFEGSDVSVLNGAQSNVSTAARVTMIWTPCCG